MIIVGIISTALIAFAAIGIAYRIGYDHGYHDGLLRSVR